MGGSFDKADQKRMA